MKIDCDMSESRLFHIHDDTTNQTKAHHQRFFRTVLGNLLNHGANNLLARGSQRKNKQNTDPYKGAVFEDGTVFQDFFEVISDGLGSGFRDFFVFSLREDLSNLIRVHIFFIWIETTNLCCLEPLVGVVLYQLEFHSGGGFDSCFWIIWNYSPNMS